MDPCFQLTIDKRCKLLAPFALASTVSSPVHCLFWEDESSVDFQTCVECHVVGNLSFFTVQPAL